MEAIVDTRHYDNHFRFSPGSEGSVGDVNTTFRLRQSNPDMPIRFEKGFGSRCGSNVRQGGQQAFFDGGGPARLYDSNWTNRKRLVNHGFVFSNPKNTGKTCGVFVQSQGRPQWQSKTESLINSFTTGDRFLPPAPFSLDIGGLPRGVNTPTIKMMDNDGIEVVRQPQALKGKTSRRFK